MRPELRFVLRIIIVQKTNLIQDGGMAAQVSHPAVCNAAFFSTGGANYGRTLCYSS